MTARESTPGSKGEILSRVGLGSWVFGGTGWGHQEDADSIGAIHRAVERGVSWIDTAPIYGLGRAETLVGRALADLPLDERPCVFTKCGLVWDDRAQAVRREIDPPSIRRQCEASLRRLGVERLDGLQIHWPTEDPVAVEAAWATIGELVYEGKVRWGGVCNFDVALLDRCAAVRPIDVVGPPLSLIERRAAADVIPWAAARGAAVVVYSPLQSGLLTGHFSAERLAAMRSDDWRPGRPAFREPALTRTLALVERLRPLAGAAGGSLIELAVAWTLAWPGVTSAIVGARRPAQVDAWAEAPGLRLDARLLDAIAAAIAATGAGEGPARPGAGVVRELSERGAR